MATPTIEWKRENSYPRNGTATTKSGKKAFIFQANTQKGIYFSVWIEGQKKNAATRATLQNVYNILETN